MSFKSFSDECAAEGITVVKNKNCKFFYNSGNINDLKDLHDTLVEQRKDTTIYVNYHQGNLYYTPADPTYIDYIVSAIVF